MSSVVYMFPSFILQLYLPLLKVFNNQRKIFYMLFSSELYSENFYECILSSLYITFLYNP
jgi:hypothetical protein